MENRVAIVGIIVKDHESADCINSILHEYSQYVIGRMGLPYREKNFYIISIVVDASDNIINELIEKIDDLNGVEVKILYA